MDALSARCTGLCYHKPRPGLVKPKGKVFRALDESGLLFRSNFLSVGKVVPDEKGGFAATVITSYNGKNLDGTIPLAPEHITGTYTMDSTLCKVTMTYNLNPSTPIVMDALMIDHARLAAMFLTPGTNMRGTLNRE